MLTSRGTFMNWLDDPWTLGSYSFPEPGAVTHVGPLLHQSLRRRVYFAGEHTCYAFNGYMEGALCSGLRVAEQIARRDKVI
jgi:monoamine oxidase